MRLIFAFALMLLGAAVGMAAPQESVEFDTSVLPFLREYCVRCHGEKKPDGDLRLDTIQSDFVNEAATWDEIRFRLTGREMPPKDAKQPTAEQTARVVEWINARLKEGEAARMAKRDAITFSKLTRDEYAATIRDWLGVNYDPGDPPGLPDDENWQGFERVGAVQSVSPSHIEKYFTAAEAILAEAFPDQEPKPFEFRRDGWQMNGGPHHWAEWEAAGIKDRVRFPIWPGWSLQHGRAGAGRIVVSGDYRFRVKLSGLKPEQGLAPHLVVYANELDRVLFERDIVAAEDEPITLEFVAHLPAGMTTLKWLNQVPGPSILPTSGRAGSKPFLSIKEGREPWQTKLTDEDGKPLWPFLILDSIEITGPITSERTLAARREFWPAERDSLEQVRAALGRFTSRAFRRPVTDVELDRLMRLIEKELAAGEKFSAAYRTAMLAVMTSKDFLHVVEGNVGQASSLSSSGSPSTESRDSKSKPNESQAGSLSHVTDHELATRLSYFLWSSLPDDELLAAARAGTLHQSDELRKQTRRMLADPKSRRFAAAFPRQWLQLQKVGMFPPDKKLYPDYDSVLEQSFHGETLAFFREVLDQNLSLREFIDSDWTMLNARLASHYGIDATRLFNPNANGVGANQTTAANGNGDKRSAHADGVAVKHEDFIRIALTPNDHRGGLLTQASVLSLTSDGQRHRPVHRGKWLLDVILNQSPPPPPANVEAIEPTAADQPKATIRAKLDAHKNHESCAACHRKIDPLGFAFDHFDAIGRYRTHEATSDGRGDNPPVDARGELPDGRTFTNAAEFKRLLLANPNQFHAAFVEKLATFALRRTMTFDDRESLAKIVEQSRAADDKLCDVIEALVTSELFQRR